MSPSSEAISASEPAIVSLTASDGRGSPIDAIVATLEEEIVLGRLSPRARLVEDDVMARFSAKRYFVREALARLVNMGVAVKTPNRGVSVRQFEVEEVEQVYQVREILQAASARLIPLPGDLTLVARLSEIQAEHTAAVARSNLRDVLRINSEFHDTLFGACGNVYLCDTIRHHANLLHAVRSYRIADPVLLAQARDEHLEMIDALQRGDRKTLVRLCVDHILPSKRAYLQAHRHLARFTAVRTARAAHT